MSPLYEGLVRRWAARTFLLVSIWGIGPGSAAAMVLGDSSPAGVSPTYQQIDPDQPLETHFREVSEVSLAIVTVPDPRVPRHRRAYDLSIVALIQGMIDTGYALDRYAFPWEQALKKKGDAETGSTLETDDCKFGLMIFRRDAWRQPTVTGQAAAPALRALYIVPETNTYGVPRGTMFAAMRAIERQRSGKEVAFPADWCPAKKAIGDQPTGSAGTTTEPARHSRQGEFQVVPGKALLANPLSIVRPRLATHSHCDVGPMQRGLDYVLVLGPSFSGTMDSLAQINRTAVRRGLPRMCAVSASATTASNDRILAFPQLTARSLEFHRLANNDDEKLAELWSLAERIGADGPGKVAILNEATVFGRELCPADRFVIRVGKARIRDKLCANAVKISFPSNIADVRAGLPRKGPGPDDLKSFIPTVKSLPLDNGTGNGSEFPDSLQSSLTTAGTELELRKAIRMLAEYKPRLIIVVATDVRDRLFLFDLLREGAPYAQLVDIELDVLMTHPSQIHATRGAVLVGSDTTIAEVKKNRLGIQNFAVASTDYQVVLRRVLRGLDSGDRVPRGRCPPAPVGPAMELLDDEPILHVVGRIGVVPLDCPSWSGLLPTRWLSPLLGLLGIVLLMMASPPMNALLGRAPVPGRFSKWVCRKLRDWIQVADPAIHPSLGSLLVGMACLLLAAFVGGGKSTFVMALVALPVLCWALAYQAGTYEMNNLALRRLHFGEDKERVVRHGLGVLALLLMVALTSWWAWQELVEWDRTTLVAIERLAYRADQGLAIGAAMTIAVLGLLFTDNALSVARSASLRNGYVVLDALWSADQSPSVRSRVEGMFKVAVFPGSPTMAAGLLVLALCIVMAMPLKTGLFGPFVSALAVVAVVALNLLALAFLANAVRIRQRAIVLTRVIQALGREARKQGDKREEGGARETPADAPARGTLGSVLRAMAKSLEEKKPTGMQEGVLGLWPASDGMQMRFATTPAVARIKDAGQDVKELLGPAGWIPFARHLSLLRLGVSPLPRESRVALYVLLASEVSQTRWATFSSAACSLGVAAFVYLYPVSGANGFALFALALLIINGIFAGYTAMSFERDEVMSNILCNRTAKVEFSATLFNYTAFPFVVLAISLAIVQIPGVLDWSEGLFKTLLNVSRGKAF